MKDEAPVLLPDISITKLQKSEGSPGSSVEDLGESPRPRSKRKSSRRLVVGCRDPANMVTSEIQGESQPVRTPLRCEWPFLMVTTYFPTLELWYRLLSCCDHQYWMLEEKAPFSVCPGLVLSGFPPGSRAETGSRCDSMDKGPRAHDKPQLDQEGRGSAESQMPLRNQGSSCLQGMCFVFVSLLAKPC